MCCSSPAQDGGNVLPDASGLGHDTHTGPRAQRAAEEHVNKASRLRLINPQVAQLIGGEGYQGGSEPNHAVRASAGS
jgi:hypothetical protein